MAEAAQSRGFWAGVQSLLPKLVPVVGGAFLIFILVDELRREGIEVQPISVPARMVEAGLTPEVVALRLMDALLQLQDSVGGEPRRRTGAEVGGSQPDFTVPLTGLSLRSLAISLRGVLGIEERRVSGEITVDGDVLRLRLRLSGHGVVADVSHANADALIRAGAPEVWRVVQPILYAWWLSSEAPSEGAMRETLSEMMAQSATDTRLMQTARLLMGRSLNRTGESEASLVINEALLREAPGYSPAVYGRGRALRELGRLDEAMEALEQSRRALPSASFPLVGIAQVLRDRGQHQPALDLLMPVARDARTVDSQGRVELAMALIGLGRAREALPYARRAVAEDTKNPSAQSALGFALLLDRQPEPALRAFDAAIALAPLWGEGQLGRIEALVALGRDAEAAAALEQARPVIAAVPRLREGLARLGHPG